MPTATNLYMNWATVSITPFPRGGSAGTAVPIKEVLDIEIDGRSMQKIFYGDNRHFARLITNRAKTRKITLKGGAVNTLLLVPDDTEFIGSATLYDAFNQSVVTTGSGAITIAWTGGVRESMPIRGANNEFAGADLTFNCSGVIATDNTDDADPFTISVA